MKLRSIALLLLFALGLALAPAARAEEGAPQDDLKERIKKQMEKILDLMSKNEAALLKLSTANVAKTHKIDVPVPEGKSGASGTPGGDAGASQAGREAAKALEKLANEAREQGGMIPEELKKLVEMIPL